MAKWVWLLPLTYVFHIAEEYRGGEGFPRWIARVAGGHMGENDFLVLNILALVLMVISLALVIRWAACRWMLTAIAGVTLLNGVSHAIACVITRSYSPGTITGMLFWLPLGVFILSHEWRSTSPSTFRAGVIGAVGMHIMVCVLAMYG